MLKMKLFLAINFCYEEFTMHIYIIKVRIYWFDTNMRQNTTQKDKIFA